MAEADLGVRVFLIDNLSSPMGLVTDAVAMLGSAILSGLSQAEMMGNELDALSEKLALQQAAVEDAGAAWIASQDALAANTLGIDDLSIALQDVQQEMTRVAAEPVDTFINDAALQKAMNDLDLYTAKVQITQDRLTLLNSKPPTAANDIAIANAELQLKQYQQKVQAAQDAISAAQMEGAATQQAELAALKEAYDALIAEQDELVVKAGEAGAALDAESAKLADVQAESGAAEGALAGLNDTLLGLGATLGAGIDFAAFAEGIKAADSAAADLTTTMNSVSIAGNLTDGQLGQMQNYLMGVANTSIYTADQVGQGFALLEEKGYSATQVEAGLGKQAINLSMAIGDQSSGTTGSVNALATAMEVMRAKSSDAGKYADLLTFAFYHGIPSVDGLRSALEQVGGRAQMLGIPFDQLVASLSQLGRAGMTGQQAGAALNYALQALYSPIQKTTHELEYLGLIALNQHVLPQIDALIAKGTALGGNMPTFDGSVSGLEAVYDAAKKVNAVPLDSTFYQWAIDNRLVNSAFYDSNGKAKDLISSLHILYTTLKNKTPEEQSAAFQQLFNVRSSQGVTQLMESLGKLDTTYAQLTGSQDALGLSTEDASKRLNSQSAQAQALKTTFTDFLAQVGQPIQDFMKSLFAGLNHVIGGFTTGSPAIHQFFTAFLTAGTAMSGVGLLIGLIVLAFSALSATVLTVIGVVLGVMAGIAALGAVIGGIVTLIQNWSHVSQGVQDAIKLVGAALGILGAIILSIKITGLITSFIEMVPAILATIPPLFAQAAAMAVAAARMVAFGAVYLFFAVQSIPAVIAGLWSMASAWIASNAAMLLAAGPITLLVVLIAGMIIGVVLLVNHLGGLTFLLNAAKAVWAQLLPIFREIGTEIKGAFTEAIKQLQPVWTQLVAAFNQAKPALMVLGQILGGVIVLALGILIGLIVGLAKAFAALLVGVIHVISGIVMVVSGIIQFFMGFFQLLHGLFTGNSTEIQRGWEVMKLGLLHIVTGMFTAILGVFQGFFGAILGFISGFIGGIIHFFMGLADSLVHHSIIPDMINAIMQWFWKLFLIPGQLITGLVGGILRMAGLLISAFQNGILFPLENLFKNLASQALVWGINLIQGFINGIGSMLGNVANAASNVVNTVKNFLGFHSPAKEGPGSDADQWMPNLMHMLTIGITGGIPGMHNAASQAAGALQSGFYSPGMSRTSSSYAQANASINGGNTTVPINIDGQAVTTVVLNRLTGQVQMSGSGRLLR